LAHLATLWVKFNGHFLDQTSTSQE